MPVEHTPTLPVVHSCKVVAKNSLILQVFFAQGNSDQDFFKSALTNCTPESVIEVGDC